MSLTVIQRQQVHAEDLRYLIKHGNLKEGENILERDDYLNAIYWRLTREISLIGNAYNDELLNNGQVSRQFRHWISEKTEYELIAARITSIEGTKCYKNGPVQFALNKCALRTLLKIGAVFIKHDDAVIFTDKCCPQHSFIAYRNADQQVGLALLAEKIGRGAYSKVYKVLLLGTGAAIAAKLARDNISQNPKKEFDVLKSIHQNGPIPGIIAAPLHYLSLPRRGYLMPIYEGTLNNLFNCDSHEDLITPLLTVMEGVDQLIQKGCYHRDIKPNNIFYQRENNRIYLALGDFGITIHADKLSKPNIRQLGTPEYHWATDFIVLNRCHPTLRGLALELIIVYAFGFTLLQTIHRKSIDPEDIESYSDALQDPAFKMIVQAMMHADIGKRPRLRLVIEQLRKTLSRSDICPSP